MTAMRERQLVQRPWVPRLIDRAKGDLPDGIAGSITGRACVYGVADAYGTMFKAGCFDKTRAEKVASGKVQLFLDHEHETKAHIGVVRETPDIGNALMMFADCFDTDAGRSGLDYCKTVITANAFTGLSVGVYIRDADYEPDPSDPQDKIFAFKEVELAEISVTPMPAVPGTEVMHARRTPEERVHAQLVALRTLLTTVPRKELLTVAREFGLGELTHPDAGANRNANGHTPTDSEIRSAATTVATVGLDERIAFVRSEMKRLHTLLSP